MRWLLVVLCLTTAAFGQARSLVPGAVDLVEPARKALEAEWLSDEERRQLRVRHGVWDEGDLTNPQLAAEAALMTWRLDDPSLSSSEVSLVTRADALIRRGRYDEAMDLLESSTEQRAAVLRAIALERTGQYEEADRIVDAALLGLDVRRATDSSQLVDAVEAIAIRARVQGRPSQDYQTMMGLLGRARNDLDRLDWRARLQEARLLVAKHNRSEAVAALHEVLGLNPRCAEAWFLLGKIALRVFDFDSATRAIAALRQLNSESVLADLLQAEAAIVNNDPDRAIEILDMVLVREPAMREAHALRAAADAVSYDLPAARARLDAMDALAPGCPDGYYEVGRFLAKHRQYGDAAEILEEAVARRPSWSPPLIELGLLEMQSGRDDRALDALQKVAELDPFNERATFSLRLLEELAAFESLESEHFVIRYLPGVDEVVARMMPEALDRMHEDVAGRFGHVPANRTVIEVMPDHEFFSVRITGMPWIHTIAACTGPVIAMEVPREGAPSKHLGLFDWLEVLRHEYTHTITLDQTRNRIPHWLTEAASVSMETRPRDYQTATMLALALRQGELFDMDGINWAFVRPKKPTDRPMAYAQGAWMVEFMNERWGEDALVELLGHYFAGRPEREAMPAALGISTEQFHADFLVWAEGQARDWGFFAEPTLDQLKLQSLEQDPEYADALKEMQTARLRSAAERIAGRMGQPAGPGSTEVPEWPAMRLPQVPLDDEQVDAWVQQYPDHPDLLEFVTRRAIDRDERTDEDAIALLERYRQARPVDPYPDRVLARMYLESDDPSRAIRPLARLDSLSENDPSYAYELALQYRQGGNSEDALESALRMVRIDPYRPGYRELVAAIALEAGRPKMAQEHIKALVLLEPDRPIHQKRLEAVNALIQSSTD